SPDGTRLAVTCTAGGDTEIVTVDADGTRSAVTIAGTGDHGSVTVRDATSGRILRTFRVVPTRPTFSPDGRHLAMLVGNLSRNVGDMEVQIRELASGRVSRTLRGEIFMPAFSPDGTRLAAVGAETVTIWDVASEREILTLPRHAGLVSMVAF